MFTFEKLPFAYDALEPYIDAATMKVHYEKHHQAYFDNFTKAITSTPVANDSLENIFSKISTLPVAVRNNGGGFWNHNFFWAELTPNGSKNPVGKSAEAIKSTFGTVESLKEQFNQAAMQRFGSGWAWLIVTPNGLEITTTPNQDNPLMEIAEKKGHPILAVDVWEHAYYLKYNNRRAEYLEAFWHVINWDYVDKQFNKIKG